MSQNPTETEEWKVALAPDNIATMTLDQLDAAYEEGQIGEDTLVWTDGMDEWLPLSEVAGGEEEAEEAAPAVAEAAAPVAAPDPAAVVQQSPAQSAAAIAPVEAAVAPVQAPVGSIPMQSAPVAAAPVAPAAVSTAPMAINTELASLDIGEDFGAGRSNKGKVGMLVAAAVVLAGVGLTAMNMSGGSEQDPAVAAALAQPVQAPAGGEEVAAAAKKNDPNAPLTGGGYEVSAAEEKAFKKEAEKNAELKEEMEKALEGSASAGSSKKSKAKAAKGAMLRKYGGASKKRSTKKSQPQKKSKSKSNSFDPLNADLP